MAEEFQESEVIFQENSTNEENYQHNFKGHSSSGELQKKKLKKRRKNKKKNSVPINIPENVHQNSWFQYADLEMYEDEYYDDGEIVPPHVISARQLAGKIAFSVCTGNGRTLKGRDLCEVRNSILRMTGFLEA